MATTYFFITPPVKNQAWEFWCLLTSQADTDVFQTTVTLAAGDVTIFRDGASLGNIDTLPTEVGVTGVLRVQLSADEMNGDRFTLVKFHDAAGAEWQDKAFLVPIMQAVTVSDLTAAQVNAQVDTALADVDLDHLIQITAGAEEPTDGSYLDQVMNKNASQTFDASTDSLEAIRDTLTPGSVNVVSFVSGDTLNFVVGVTFDQTLPQSGSYTISATWSKMYFTLKRDADIETDAQAVVKIQATNGGAASDGLIVLNGSSSGLTAANASLTVNQVAGTVRLIVTDDAAAQLTELDGLTWDFKEITAGGASNVVTRGQATVSYTPTRAIT